MLNRGLDKQELLRIVEAVANEKSIDKELVIESMESAIQKAALTKFGNNNDIEVKIDTVQRIKAYFKEQLLSEVKGVYFNGDTSNEGGLYTVLNVSLPPSDNASTLLFQLDMNGICASGGSACNSGAVGDSHVLNGILHPTDRSALRFSFSKFTTKEEVDYAISKLKELI